MTPGQFYKQRLGSLREERKKLQQRKTIFGIVRFGNIALLIAAFYFLWNLGVLYLVIAAVLLLAIFIRLIYRDLANRAALEHNAQLIRVNEDELMATEGNYHHFANGSNFAPKEHYYSNDLDIFGQASLYQFINRTTAEVGGLQLADWLLEPANTEHILLRQEAVR
ncbi:MAG: hypothetical protein EOO88_62685, partial [Pedobacter sp.]